MKVKNKSGATPVRLRNLVRGAISRLRASGTPGQPRHPWREQLLVQSQINRAMAIAKRELTQNEITKFENWVATYSREQNQSSNRLGANLTALGLLPLELKARDLITELHLAESQLARRFNELKNFSNSARKVASLIDCQDWQKALLLVRALQEQQGQSYWAIETELALMQSLKGIEAIKEHIATLSICTSGLNKFFLYHFGVRNEPAQTSARFKANLKNKIENSEIPIEWQSYSKFRLYNSLTADPNLLAHVLAGEQLTTSIDLLFTVIKLTRFIFAHTNAFSDDVTNCARRIYEGLVPIISILATEPAHHAADYDLYFCPDSLLDSISRAAIVTMMQPNEKWKKPDSLYTIIEQGLASALSTRSDGVAAEELSKVLLNLAWHPTCIDLGEFSEVPSFPQLMIASAERMKNAPPSASAYDSLCMAVISLTDELPEYLGELEPLLSGLKDHFDGKSDEGIRKLRIGLASAHPIVQDAAKVLLSNCLYNDDDIEECLSVCCAAGMENDRLIPMLPLSKILLGIKWVSLRRFSNSIDLAIALDHLLSIIDDRKIRTYKRYAVEELLTLHKAATLVELADALVAVGENVSKIEYFLYHVCDIVTIELLPKMGESRKVWAMRSDILCRLAALHTNAESSHLREAEAINQSLQVDDGLFVLDDSKVYVDEQPILKSINAEFSADFQRYLRLVESGIGVSESLNDVLKGFRNISARTFQIPKNDADDLLANLIQSMLDRFLFDQASGLDTIIGRRIRHGTIAGEIRGYLEGVGLIGHKPHAGAEYDIPPKVESQLSGLDPKRRQIVSAAFSRFSESIDHDIALLRDDYFCVRSKSKPRGLFEVPFSTILFALARSVAQACQSIDQFSRECFELFWFTLSGRLNASRPTVEADTKKSLSAIFTKLTNDLRAVNVANPEFFACLLQASEELQRRAAIIASWVRVPKASIEGKKYSLQRAVDVACAVVSGQRPGFSPIVTYEVADNPELDTHGFSIVEDALYIAFDNIAQHSGKKANNHITVNITFDEKPSLLVFTITNEVAPNSRTSEREAHVNGVRADIQKRAYGERARLNRGGSGLAKLASIVMQSDRTSIWFGYVSADKFQLKFELVYVGFPEDGEPTATKKINE